MKKLIFTGLLLGGALLLSAPSAHAIEAPSDSGSTAITLDADTVLTLSVTGSLNINPTAADYAANSVEKLDSNGIHVTITSNSSTGATLSVSGTAGATLDSSLIQVRQSNAKASYLQLTNSPQQIFTQATPMLYSTPVNFNVDVKVSPLQGVGDTAVTNTLNFSAVANAGVVPPA